MCIIGTCLSDFVVIFSQLAMVILMYSINLLPAENFDELLYQTYLTSKKLTKVCCVKIFCDWLTAKDIKFIKISCSQYNYVLHSILCTRFTSLV